MASVGLGEWLVLITVLCALLFYFLDWMIALSIIAFLLLLWLWRRNRHFGFFKRLGVDGPPPSILMGNIPDYQKDGIYASDLKWSQKYGKIYGVFSGSQPELMVLNPDLMRLFLEKDFSVFTNRGRENRNVSERSMFSKLLTIAKADRWKPIRRTVDPAFASSRVKQMVPLILDRIKITGMVIDDKIVNGELLDLKKVIGNLTMDIMGSIAFGIDINAQRSSASPFIKYANESIDIVSVADWRIIVQVLFSWTVLKLQAKTGFQLLFKEGEEFFTSVVHEMIKQRQSNPSSRPDFLTLLLQSMEQDDADLQKETNPQLSNVAKIKLSLQEIVAQSFIFLAAGYDTSSTCLQFCIYNLTLHPEVQEELHGEIVRILSGSEYPNYELVQRMPFLEAVINETLRMYPPGLRVERRAAEDYTLGEINIPKGTIVASPIYAIHHSAEYYPEPESFKPERFLPEEVANRDPMTFIPFGYGPRNCIGQRFAMTQFKLALAYLVPRFKFLMDDKTLRPPFEFAKFGFLKPEQELILRAEKRNYSHITP